MPQASDEDRRWAEQKFGDPINDAGPRKFLQDKGWILTQQWEWIPPPGFYEISDDEYRAIMFLIDEWDFGGIKR